jgi:hypothetical protein
MAVGPLAAALLWMGAMVSESAVRESLADALHSGGPRRDHAGSLLCGQFVGSRTCGSCRPKDRRPEDAPTGHNRRVR